MLRTPLDELQPTMRVPCTSCRRQFMNLWFNSWRSQFMEEAQADENSSLRSFEYIKALSVAVRYSNPKLHAGLLPPRGGPPPSRREAHPPSSFRVDESSIGAARQFARNLSTAEHRSRCFNRETNRKQGAPLKHLNQCSYKMEILRGRAERHG